MKDFVYGILACFLVACTCAVVWISNDLHETIADSDAAILESRKLIVQLEPAVRDLNAAAQQAKLAATEQRKSINGTLEETQKSARAFRLLLDRTDMQLNRKLLPDLEAQVDNVSAASQVAIESLGHSADTLTMQLNDPHIMSLAANLDQSAANVADATGNLKLATADIQVRVHQMTKPASWAARIGSTILGFGAKFAQILTAAK